MNLVEYAKTQDFIEGFPQGDTILEIENCDFEDFQFTDENGKKITRTKIKTQNGKVLYCARTVVKELLRVAKEGKKRARVTRTGMKLETRYTVVGLD